ncbi:MAG: polyisoprenoid-binding protein [Alphaproteobacteria bacterium]|nr:polyisoprenoid-binding protein [Alphaproteobacteria bacterium]
MRRLFTMTAVLALAAACSPGEEQNKTAETKTEAAAPAAAIVPVKTEAPAGVYKLDKTHASLIFRVNHIGFSNYTANFSSLDAELQFDPANPEKSSVTATIDPRSLVLNAPPAGFLDELLNPKWLDAAGHPQMTFRSTKVELTGANTARITGDFTMKGVTLPVTLEATFNGGYAGHAYEPQARIGFSARGTLARASFGVKEGVPPPGSTMGVSDNVDFVIEAEFSGPPLANAPAPLPN